LRHTAVWTGTEMIVWGGYNGSSWLNDGWRYDPATDQWTSMSSSNAPSARENHTAIWTGTEHDCVGRLQREQLFEQRCEL
jgi:N-acetylneuraminic acid mutarotase